MNKLPNPKPISKPAYLSTSFTLASSSAIRTKLLKAAGLSFKAMPVAINEAQVISQTRHKDASQIALEVATQKALALTARLRHNPDGGGTSHSEASVGTAYGEASSGTPKDAPNPPPNNPTGELAGKLAGELIVAADQLCQFEGKYPPKPSTIAEARQLLEAFCGKELTLYCGAVAMRNGKTLWQTAPAFKVKFRKFSTQELEHYLADASDEILGVATAVCFEGKGIRLIETTHGDFFCGLGFPLMEFLEFLRTEASKRSPEA